MDILYPQYKVPVPLTEVAFGTESAGHLSTFGASNLFVDGGIQAGEHLPEEMEAENRTEVTWVGEPPIGNLNMVQVHSHRTQEVDPPSISKAQKTSCARAVGAVKEVTAKLLPQKTSKKPLKLSPSHFHPSRPFHHML